MQAQPLQPKAQGFPVDGKHHLQGHCGYRKKYFHEIAIGEISPNTAIKRKSNTRKLSPEPEQRWLKLSEHRKHTHGYCTSHHAENE
jgi:hypothetical protein